MVVLVAVAGGAQRARPLLQHQVRLRFDFHLAFYYTLSNEVYIFYFKLLTP